MSHFISARGGSPGTLPSEISPLAQDTWGTNTQHLRLGLGFNIARRAFTSSSKVRRAWVRQELSELVD